MSEDQVRRNLQDGKMLAISVSATSNHHRKQKMASPPLTPAKAKGEVQTSALSPRVLKPPTRGMSENAGW